MDIVGHIVTEPRGFFHSSKKNGAGPHKEPAWMENLSSVNPNLAVADVGLVQVSAPLLYNLRHPSSRYDSSRDDLQTSGNKEKR